MHVVATAGHVDHGKSTLVRALTGRDPDRWAEEHRRGLTIDLGYVWTTLPDGEEVAFVDVPGHRRFIGNMLAGLGPAPAVMIVVAADEGWREQSEEHLAAVDALGLEHGLLVVSRADLADPAPTLARARERIARSSLGEVPAVAVSAVRGEGLDGVRRELAALVGRLPPPDVGSRLRLWVDRSFTVRGAGTVVTGTLGAGRIRVGDELVLRGREVRVRGLHRLERPRDEVSAVARVAVNLRGVEVAEVGRGDALLSPGDWATTTLTDVRVRRAPDVEQVPTHVTVHVGTAAVRGRVRPLGHDSARVSLVRPLPLMTGDRVVVRDPGAGRIVAGAVVLDPAPPGMVRRGDARRRAEALLDAPETPDLLVEVRRRGHLSRTDLRRAGVDLERLEEAPVVSAGEWIIDRGVWQAWQRDLRAAVTAHAEAHPLDPAPTLEAARARTGLPDLEVVRELARAAELDLRGGRVGLPGVLPSLGAAERGLRKVEARLREQPFDAPDRPTLEAAGLGPAELAAAVAGGRLVRLADDIVLLTTAPALAMRELAGLEQPFTTSAARQALGTSRRVVIPLLEHLDARGWTRRIDAGHREVVRARTTPGPTDRD